MKTLSDPDQHNSVIQRTSKRKNLCLMFILWSKFASVC